MGRQKLGKEQAWEVEAILDERKSARWNCTEFLIKWRGYSHNDNSWEPESGIACDDLLAAFRAKNKKTGSQKKKEDGKTPTKTPTKTTPKKKAPSSTPKKSSSDNEDPDATDDDDDQVIIVKKKKKPSSTPSDDSKKRKKPASTEKSGEKQNGSASKDDLEKNRKKLEYLESLQRMAREGSAAASSSSSVTTSSSSASTPFKTLINNSLTSTSTSITTVTTTVTTDSSKKKKKNNKTPEEIARKEAKREKKRRKLAKREAEEQAKLKATKEEKPTVKAEKKDDKSKVKSEPPKPIKKLPPTNLCSVCRDRDENPVIACQRCGVEVHPGCYGVQSVSADWKCALCDYVQAHPKESAESYHCCLCPSLSGALKPAVDGRWAHSACALWIPETSFGNNDTLEPVMGLSDIPKERWELVCCICNKSAYCCIQCDFGTCCESFHVTCAQDAGLRVEFVPVKTDEATASMTALAYCKEHGIQKTKLEDDETESEEEEQDENSKLIERMKDANSIESRLAIFENLTSFNAEALQNFCKPFVEADGLAVFATWMDEGLRDIASIKRGEKVDASFDTLIYLERQILKTLKRLWEVEKYESGLLRQQRLISQTSQLGRSDRAPDGELAGLAHSLYYRWTGERLEVQPGTPYVLPRSSRDYDDMKRGSGNSSSSSSNHMSSRTTHTHQRDKPKNRFLGRDVNKMDGFGGYHKSSRESDYNYKPRDNSLSRSYYSSSSSSSSSSCSPSSSSSSSYHGTSSYHNNNFASSYTSTYLPPLISSDLNPYPNKFSTPPPLPSYFPPVGPSIDLSAPPPPPPRGILVSPANGGPPSHLPPIPTVVAIEDKLEPKPGVSFSAVDGSVEDLPKVSSWPPKRTEPMASSLKGAAPRRANVQWANEQTLCEWIEFTVEKKMHVLKIKKKDKKVRTKKVLRVGTPIDTD